jgi:hypothetical protein
VIKTPYCFSMRGNVCRFFSFSLISRVFRRQQDFTQVTLNFYKKTKTLEKNKKTK